MSAENEKAHIEERKKIMTDMLFAEAIKSVPFPGLRIYSSEGLDSIPCNKFNSIAEIAINFSDLENESLKSRNAELESELSKYKNLIRSDNSKVIATLEAKCQKYKEALDKIANIKELDGSDIPTILLVGAKTIAEQALATPSPDND